jgi:small GTP-binding protein
MLLGDSGVGKTSVSLRLIDDRFYECDGCDTVGIEYGIKSIRVKGKKVRLQIWDIAGQDRFLPIALAYLEGVSVIIIMYDISARHTFDSVTRYWLPHIRKEKGSHHKTMILVGNKADKFADRQVSTEEAQSLASKEGLWLYETSAYDGTFIDNLFCDTATDLLMNIHENIILPSDFRNMGITDDLHLNATPVSTTITDERDCSCVLQ